MVFECRFLAKRQQRTQALEMKCYWTILDISYVDCSLNDTVQDTIKQQTEPLENLISTVMKRKSKWYGHIIRANNLFPDILQDSTSGKRRDRQEKLADIIIKWTRDLNISMQPTHMEETGQVLSCTATLWPYLVIELMMMRIFWKPQWKMKENNVKK